MLRIAGPIRRCVVIQRASRQAITLNGPGLGEERNQGAERVGAVRQHHAGHSRRSERGHRGVGLLRAGGGSAGQPLQLAQPHGQGHHAEPAEPAHGNQAGRQRGARAESEHHPGRQEHPQHHRREGLAGPSDEADQQEQVVEVRGRVRDDHEADEQKR
jgi:hypothetical protein